MVGRDGVQYPPMHFPPGESTDSFLDVLESALQPKGKKFKSNDFYRLLTIITDL